MAAEGRLTHAGFESRFQQAHAETGAILFGENAHSVPPGGDPAPARSSASVAVERTSAMS